MQNPASGTLRTHGWLPHVLAILLVLAPCRANDQAPAAPQAAPPQTSPTPGQVQPMAQLPIVQNLKVKALAGDREMNDLERRVMAPLVVQVLDQNDRPVEGADVVFRFPLNGPGATFTGGKTSATVRTNGQGQAAAMNWMANNEVGTFQIRVTATYGNQMGEATVSMSNVTKIVEENKRAKQTHWYSSKWVKIAIVAGVAGAVTGIVLGTRGGSSTATTPTITISPGSPGVGGPH